MPAALRKRERDGKSRNSTPFNTTPPDEPAPNAESKKEKVQSSLDKWVEPPMANPTSSFEDAGFQRSALFQHQQPLGVPPSAKMKHKARAPDELNGRRSFFGRKTNTFGDDAASTPEMTPAPELDREDSERHDDDEMQAAVPVHDEEEDDDYIPKKSKAKAPSSKGTIRGKTPTNKTPARSKTPLNNGTGKVSPAVAPSSAQGFAASGDSSDEEVDMAAQQRLQIALNDACQRANQNGDPRVAIALREMWQVSHEDPRYMRALNGIIQRKPTIDQQDRFAKFIKIVKRREKLVSQEQRERELNEAESEPLPLLPDHSDAVSAPGEDEVAPSDSASNANASPSLAPRSHQSPSTKSSTKGRAKTVSDSLDSLPTALALPSGDEPSPPTTRAPSKSPRKKAMVNGNATLGSRDATRDASTAVPTPESGAGSDSDLSDVNEEIVQNGPPEPLKVNGTKPSNAAPAVSKKGRNAALARAGKKAKAMAKGKYEKKQPTAEELAEQQELDKKRQALLERQAAHMEYNPPVSDIRFDDEILETESLTSSQIAVGPPVDASRPRRAGRAPRQSNGTAIQAVSSKRGRGDSSRLPSPVADSTGTTRPSTPVLPPPHQSSKRVKLNNGQAARIKRSPIKNRDGPIAGIAHSGGGGGARHSGPDDNEPGSPPESDDLCAACKGAGEFVCCENCPRVFHFMCCDPPLAKPPKGSFYCYECTAKLKLAEESVAEVHTHLAPLFKALEKTNTRAFALPTDIQNHFENVSARADGSYFENTKKIPLAKSSGYGFQKPDYFRDVDADGKVILCTSCGQTTGHGPKEKRAMLKCDFCDAYWHLDCCDPPLANPPNISLEASQRDAWKCPRHVDHDFRSGRVLQKDLNDDDVQMADADLADRVLPRRVRKLKKPETVDPTFSRGMRNNGLIDIINDPDDDTDGEGNYVFPRDRDESKDMNSKIYRVPEKGIILDFITKIKGSRVTKQKKVHEAAKPAAGRKTSLQHFAVRPIEQQQAALNLAKLAHQEQDIGMGGMDVDALILNLTAEAPQDVATSIDKAPPPPLAASERDQLLMLQELIARRLG